MTTLAQLPPSFAGTTQTLVLSLYHTNGAAAIRELDSVEVFDGPETCCDGASPFATLIQRTNNNTILQWRSISNRTYQVQFKSSLHPAQTWTDAGAAILARGPLTSHTNTSSGSNGFYRVGLNP